jgi:hypothetical protein
MRPFHRRLRRVLPAVFCVAALAGLADAGAQSKHDEAANALRDATATPANADALARYIATLPRDGDLYIVEGDLLMTEAELVASLKERHTAPLANAVLSTLEAKKAQRPELLVDEVAGHPNFLKTPSERALTYAVDPTGFSSLELAAVAANVRQAADEWQDLCPECGVTVTTHPMSDASTVSFVVRRRNVSGGYIAASFYPNDPPAEHFLNVDPTYFVTTYDKVGVFRHELGHILGYRHEQNRPDSGCYLNEGNDWKDLTPYDRYSVMHYFCPHGGTYDLEFTTSDRTAHRSLYGPTGSGGHLGMMVMADLRPRPSNVLTVRFAGGDVGRDMASVLATLNARRELPVGKHDALEGETLASVYAERLGPVGATPAMLELAATLNGGAAPDAPLPPGRTVVFPAVQITPFRASRRLDVRVPADAAELAEIDRYRDLLEARVRAAGGRRYVRLLGFEFKVDFANNAEASAAAGALRSLHTRNVAAWVPSARPAGGRRRR